MSEILSVPALAIVFYPFYAFFDWVSTLEINVEAINVTCEGATAPIELFINLGILGISTIVIESNLQIYRLLTFNSLTEKFLQGVTQPGYKAWSCRDNGKSAEPTYRATFAYFIACFSGGIMSIFGGFDFFLSSLSYLMSLVRMETFVSHGGVHAFSPECNAVVGWEGMDETLANLASAEAYLILFPAIYEIARVLLPGCNAGESYFDNTEVVVHEPKTTIFFPLKLMSAFNPDLFLAVMVGKWVRDL